MAIWPGYFHKITDTSINKLSKFLLKTYFSGKSAFVSLKARYSYEHEMNELQFICIRYTAAAATFHPFDRLRSKAINTFLPSFWNIFFPWV